MHTACWFTYFERCDLIAPLLEITLKWLIAMTERYNNSVSSQIPASLTRALTREINFTALNYADL